jgi:hypothetical protein
VGVKGIVFNLLEQAVTREHGEDVWDDLLDDAGVAGAYTAVGTYPHDELHALVAAASKRLGVPPDDIVLWFGRVSIPMLAERYPDFFTQHDSLESFLLSLNDIIHPEVRKLFPGAYAPEFELATPSPGVVTLGYQSHRDLCLFAEGLVHGAALHFGKDVEVTQSECVRRNGERCVIVCKLASAANAS